MYTQIQNKRHLDLEEGFFKVIFNINQWSYLLSYVIEITDILPEPFNNGFSMPLTDHRGRVQAHLRYNYNLPCTILK